MSLPTPDFEPARIVAGDTARWLRCLPDFPASGGWALAYVLVSAAQRYTFGATASGDEHLVHVASSTTGAWAPARYAWRAKVSKAGDSFTVGEGQIEVANAFASAADPRSSARRMLEAVEAVIEGRATDGVDEYTIAGRSIRVTPIPQLLALRSTLRVDVRREEAARRAAEGLAPAGRVMVRW